MTSSRCSNSLVVAALLLAGCTHAGSVQGSSPSSPGSSTVAYVQMEELVKKHPLYPQLAHVDEGITALQMRSGLAGPDLSPQEIAAAEKGLQKQLDDAAARTQTMIKAKQVEYAKRENEAMQQLLVAAGASSGVPAGAIGAAMAHTQNQQSAQAAAGSNAGLESMRKETLGNAQAQFDAAHKTLADRANDLYRARAEELQQKESAFSLSQSAAHSAERLTLRTKLSNLALDDTDRTAARARLDELDREEADGLAAMRNRDQAELSAYHNDLEKQMAAGLAKRRTEIQKQTVAQLGVAQSSAGAGGPAAPVRVVAPPGGVSADLQAKLNALHQKYQADFDKDTRQVVADFAKTREDLSRRFARLHGVDVAAQASTAKELDALKKQRSDLYDQIVAEIDGEVRVIAQKRGISVVVGSIVAPAGGIDLTPDAERVVETLHE